MPIITYGGRKGKVGFFWELQPYPNESPRLDHAFINNSKYPHNESPDEDPGIRCVGVLQGFEGVLRVSK
jgi:hypothetical protein